MERVASQSRDRSLAHGVTSVASQSLPDAKRLLNIPRIEHSVLSTHLFSSYFFTIFQLTCTTHYLLEPETSSQIAKAY